MCRKFGCRRILKTKSLNCGLSTEGFTVAYIYEIAEDYKNGLYKVKSKFPARKDHVFSKRHVFDRDKSVRWNEERRDALEKTYREGQKAARQEQISKDRRLRDDLLRSGVGEARGKLNLKQVGRLYDRAFQEKHSNMLEVFDEFSELIELVVDVLKDGE